MLANEKSPSKTPIVEDETSLPLPWRTIAFDTCLTVAIPNALLYWNLHVVAGPRSEPAFFCNDNSIRLPYKPDTIPMSFLWFYKHGVPAIVIFLVELWCFSRRQNEYVCAFEKGRPPLMRFLIRFFYYFRVHYLGMAFQMIIFILCRHTIGRMRPNYLDRCRPSIGYLACDPIHAYITSYTCTGNRTLAQLESSRQSFFSGHSSIAICVATFLTLYLQHRLARRSTSFSLVPFLQLGISAFSIFICLSRVLDNAHHPTDVLTGMLVGFSSAYLVWKHVARVDELDELTSN